MAYPILAPNSSWYKGTTLRTAITLINIVDSYSPTGNETESWNADVNDSGDIKCYVDGTTLTISGNGSGKIAANEDASYMFSDANYEADFRNVTAINNLGLIDTSNTLYLLNCFYNCRKVKTLDVDSWDVSNATDMASIFCYCMELQSVDVSNWNISNVVPTYQMFAMCQKLTNLDLSKWNLKPNGCRMMFYFCTSLTTVGDISNWDMSNCKYMHSMFDRCKKLTNLNVSKWDTSKAENMSAMFQDCSVLQPIDVSNWDVSNVTDMSFMFYNCNGLKEINVSKWDTSKLQNLDHFAAHAGLKRKGMENFNTSSLTNANAAFHNCAEEELDLSGWDVSKVKYFCQMFENAPNLKRVKGLEKWDTSSGVGFDGMFERCHKLEEVDLSSFDTSKAKNDEEASTNGHATATFYNIFYQCYELKKIKLGSKVSINGDETNTRTSCKLTFPTPSSDYIEGADGYWYTMNGDKFTPNGMKDKTAETYYASYNLIADLDMIVKNGTMIDMAKAVRTKTGKTDKMVFGEMVTAINNMDSNNNNSNIYDQLVSVIEKSSNTEISELPNSLRQIGAYIFRGHPNITITSIPSGVESIQNQAFAYCNTLEQISLPETLSIIYNQAFYNCTNLSQVTFKGTPTTISTNVFQNCTNLTTINAPWAEEAVANAPWGATNATIVYNYTGE